MIKTVSDIAIRVRALGKSYLIQHQQDVQQLRSDHTYRRLRWPWSRDQAVKRFSEETFWALRDINFDVPRGQVFGVVGRNGAGKSTLLKVLSRIVDPTTGMADIYGRVGSLLEVGTGFHPELSGRENIYLNGTLLGMRRREINAVLNDIVEFAEVERFIDTPVKRYSSGMYVRLAFAVAAHLRPEILIIDEVLAVGDIGFQKKCLGKMKDVTGEGRTVLFVSHSLSTVNSLCDQCILLENGRVAMVGPTESVTSAYYQSSQDESGPRLDLSSDPPGDDIARLISVQLVDGAGSFISHATLGEAFGIQMIYDLLDCRRPVVPNLHIFTGGNCAFVTSPPITPQLAVGRHRAVAWLPPRLLNEGYYTVNIAASTLTPQCVHFHEQDRFGFQVIEDINDPARHGYVQKIPGVVRPVLEWTIE